MAIGSGVYGFPPQRQGKTIGSLTAFLMDVFFTKETLSVSNLNGGGGGYCGYQQLNPKIVHAITIMLLFPLNYVIKLNWLVQSQFKDSKVAIVRKTIQDNCTGSWRGISKRM